MNKLLVSVAFACVVSAGFGDYVLMDCVRGQNVYNSNPSRVETDFVPLCTDRIEVRVSHGWDVHEAMLWSAGSIADGNGFVCTRVSKGSLRFDRGGTTGTATGYGNIYGENKTTKPYTVSADGSTLKCTFEGALIGTMAPGSFEVGGPLLFKLNQEGRMFSFRVYGADGAIKFDGVPAKDTSANKLGLYDRVSGKFYPGVSLSAGTVLDGEDVRAGYRTGEQGLESEVTATCDGTRGSVGFADGAAGEAASGWIAQGASATLVATPAAGCVFDYWADAHGTPVSFDPVLTVPFGPAAYTAYFLGAPGAHDPAFPLISDGLVLDLDAGDSATMMMNALGDVTNWTSRVGPAKFVPVSGLPASARQNRPPCFNASAFGGRGAVRTGGTLANAVTNTHLWMNAPATWPARTHMLVFSCPFENQHHWGWNYGYSYYGYDKAVGDLSKDVIDTMGKIGTRQSYVTGTDLFVNGKTYYLRGDGHVTGSCTYGIFACGAARVITLVQNENVANPICVGGSRQMLGGASTLHSNNATYNYPTDFAEVMNWNRELSDAERIYMECWMSAKWTDSLAVAEWTGGGDGETWNQAENWKDGVLPETSGAAVIISAAKPVKVTTDAQVAYLIMRDTAAVQVAAGASLEVEKLVSVKGTTVFSVGPGGRLCYPFFHKWPSASVTFALADATLEVAVPSRGMCSNTKSINEYTDAQNAGLVNVRSWPLAFQPHERMAGSVAGTGTVFFRSAGTQTLDPAQTFADGLAVRVACGALDLNGVSLNVSTLGGAGMVTNSAASAATVRIANAGAAEATPPVCGDIDLVIAGGEVAFGGCQPSFGGTLAVTSGAVTAKEDYLPYAMTKGVVWHLDASRVDTVVTNERGRLVRMYSCTPDRSSFGPYVSTTQMPKYDPAGLNGRPALLFATDDNGNYDHTKNSLWTGMQLDIICTNYSFAIVFLPKAKMHQQNSNKYIIGWGNKTNPDGTKFTGDGHVFGLAVTYPGKSYSTSNLVAYAIKQQDESSSALQVRYRNGTCIYDTSRSMTEASPLIVEKAQVFVTTLLPGESHVSYSVYNPCIGTSGSYVNGAFNGAIAEIIAFDRGLSHAEMQELSSFLMRKWGIEIPEGESPELTAANGALPEKGTLAIGGGATLDLGGTTSVVAKVVSLAGGATVTGGGLAPGAVEVTSGADVRVPTLAGDIDWFVEDVPFAFTGDPTPLRGQAINTTGTIFGYDALGTVSPAKVSSYLRKSAHAIRLSGIGLTILVR